MRGLQLGTSFLSALHAKYAPPAATHTPAAAAAQREHEHEQDGHEHRLFETTFGRPIEAVLKNDTVPVIARLAKLREIGLEWERVERLAPEGEDLCSEQERVALELPRASSSLSWLLMTPADHLMKVSTFSTSRSRSCTVSGTPPPSQERYLRCRL